jgi:hypothetical protein
VRATGQPYTSGTTRTFQRGGAILLVILLIPILVFLARAVAWLSTSTQFRTISHRDKIGSTYLMEAGLNHASVMLEEDSEWTEGFDEERLAHVPGTYSVSFQDLSLPYKPGNSVNNIFGSVPADGPRGPETVAPGTIELVVRVKNGRLESSGNFIMVALLDDLTELAVGSAGRIVMNGNVHVTGVNDVLNWAPLNTGIHSNQFGKHSDVIKWTPKELGDKATFTGKVSTSSTGADAITFAGMEGTDYSASSFESGAARLPVPNPDIVQAVKGNASAPPPPVNNFGTTTLSNQDYYRGSDLDLQGDLVLEGGILYVDGDLKVNGSITGKGSVYVTGKTTFKGDAVIEAKETGIALYSDGAIELTGFNGREFMEKLLSDPNDRQVYQNAISTFDAQMHIGSNTTPNPPQQAAGAKAAQAMATISNLVSARVGSGHETGDFIKEQLAAYQHDISYTSQYFPHKKEFRETTSQLKNQLNRLGTAYFQGLMVTNSYIHADSSVGVIGAMYASGDRLDPPVKIDGQTVESGDVFLGDDSEIVFNKALLDEPEAKSNEIDKLVMRTWAR